MEGQATACHSDRADQAILPSTPTHCPVASRPAVTAITTRARHSAGESFEASVMGNRRLQAAGEGRQSRPLCRKRCFQATSLRAMGVG
jgi:hypothetical protein